MAKEKINIERRFYSPFEYSRALGISKELVYKELSLGNIPHTRIGQRILIPAKTLEDLIQAAV